MLRIFAVKRVFDMNSYIWQEKDFPNFQLNIERLSPILAKIKFSQGLLQGRLEAASKGECSQVVWHTLTEEIIRSSEIEGIRLDFSQVRSSVARHLGMNIAQVPVPRDVDGAVAMTLDATLNFAMPLTHERLFSWHSALFPSGYSGLAKIKVGGYREGAMQIVSGAIGHEKIHYEAPAAPQVHSMMDALLDYVNSSEDDDVIKAAVAHLWYVTIHPFDDGNGRIARALSEMLLCRSEGTDKKSYALSSTINSSRKEYYQELEITSQRSLDITNWVEWFLKILLDTLSDAEQNLAKLSWQQRFWEEYQNFEFNSRQRKVIEKLLQGFEGKLTSSKWAKICHCSQDTAGRDLKALMEADIIHKEGEGRGIYYILNFKCHY